MKASRFLSLPLLVAAGALSYATAVLAAPPAPNAVVEAVQAPAWVVRNGSKMALAPGQQLHNRDRVVTGEGARALVQLGDGSAVKVGENGEVKINALGRKDNKVFTAALDVTTGAFRLTTDVFQRKRQQRAINVRISTITAGIRGTDIWGKADAERDLICLLEGKITVTHPQGEAVQLSEANSFYYAFKGQPPAEVGSIEADELARWAVQTEIQSGSGASKTGGRWKAILGTVPSQREAFELIDRSRAAGFATRVKPVKTEEGYAYEVRLDQLPSAEEAGAAAQRVKAALDLPELPKVAR